MGNKSNNTDKILTKELYGPHFEDLRTKNHTTDKTFNPLLIKCPEHYFDNGNVRIMVIGDATKKWFKDYHAKSVDDCLHYYNIYNAGQTDTKKVGNVRQFDFIESLNKAINGDTYNNIVWTNIFKTTESINYDRSIPGRPEQCDAWRKMHYEITKKEIELLKPDFVFFTTGNEMRNDTWYINGVLGPDAHFIPFKEDKDMALIVGIKKKLDFVCCRIPNPDEETIERMDKVIYLLDKLVKKLKTKKNDKKHSNQEFSYPQGH